MPIVNIEGLGKIEFPDSMTQEQIDRAIQQEILPMVARRVPSATVAGLSPELAAGGNPFTKGTAKADPNYKVGDRYAYRVLDLLTKQVTREVRGGVMVKEVTDTEVVYGNGSITDLLGNIIRDPQGRNRVGNQIFVAEYSVGRKWTTIYRGTRRDLEEDEWTMDLKVVARESVTVPAGTFDAFKVEGKGFIRGNGNRIQMTYWIAPDRVRRFIAQETLVHGKGNRFKKTDRVELVGFRQR
jgi:hypothetical protein